VPLLPRTESESAGESGADAPLVTDAGAVATGTFGEAAAEAQEGVAPRAVAADAFVDGLIQTAMDAVLASQE